MPTSSVDISSDIVQTGESYLDVDRIDVKFDTFHAVKQVSFKLNQGEIGCLLGFSGCGKTSLLRAIAGLEPVSSGSIKLAGQSLSRPKHILEPAKRQMGMVFQDYALFSHLNVTKNIAFGLKKWQAKARQQRIEEMLTLVGLTDVTDRRPDQLSGGQQQRVALARALAPQPKLLLLDEPFSNLDEVMRLKLAAEVRQILKKANMTALMVTHDQQEAFAIADKIGMMQAGELRQWESPEQVYHRPADPNVAAFIGEGTLINGKVVNGYVDTSLGRITRRNQPAGQWVDGQEVKVLIRPDDIVHDDASPIQLEVTNRVFRGANYIYQLALPSGERVLSLVGSHHMHEVGSFIGVRPVLEHVIIYAQDSVV